MVTFGDSDILAWGFQFSMERKRDGFQNCQNKKQEKTNKRETNKNKRKYKNDVYLLLEFTSVNNKILILVFLIKSKRVQFILFIFSY